jgi:N-acetyl-anhydromuramyl-L-alanine amidase AmpD
MKNKLIKLFSRLPIMYLRYVNAAIAIRIKRKILRALAANTFVPTEKDISNFNKAMPEIWELGISSYKTWTDYNNAIISILIAHGLKRLKIHEFDHLLNLYISQGRNYPPRLL